MVDLKCKYCGGQFKSGFACTHSPTKKHVALPDGQNCVYCGSEFKAGFHCPYSPSKKHQLDT